MCEAADLDLSLHLSLVNYSLPYFMDADRIAELLTPFLTKPDEVLLSQLQLYLDLLLHWNARTNLTAVRDPEQIVTRHFGESLLAAHVVFGDEAFEEKTAGPADIAVADVGSGAGFPGIPIKLSAPDIKITLIESQNKKATFLREVIRTLNLRDAEVYQGRAEQWGRTADVVTLRAVEKFEESLHISAALVAGEGQLCLLIGEAQADPAKSLLGPKWRWAEPHRIPGSSGRVVLVGYRATEPCKTET